MMAGAACNVADTALPGADILDKGSQGCVIDSGRVVRVSLFHPINLSDATMCSSCMSDDLHPINVMSDTPVP